MTQFAMELEGFVVDPTKPSIHEAIGLTEKETMDVQDVILAILAINPDRSAAIADLLTTYAYNPKMAIWAIYMLGRYDGSHKQDSHTRIIIFDGGL